jgi:hypothetical protein
MSQCVGSDALASQVWATLAWIISPEQVTCLFWVALAAAPLVALGVSAAWTGRRWA